MFDAIIENFRRRRAERLEKRGYRIKPNQYRRSEGAIKMSKKELLKDIQHFDEPDGEEEEENNGGRGGGRSGGGGHGNTRLPYGLCKRYGIEIGEEWTPRDAWDALAGKGITAEGAYRRLKKGEDPGVPDNPPEVEETTSEETTEEIPTEAEKEPVKSLKTSDGQTVTDLETSYSSWRSSPYMLKGAKEGGGFGFYRSFKTKEDMMYYLKKKGVEEVNDPETGELINPQEIEFPERVFNGSGWDERRYTEPSIGLRKGKYAITAKGLDGKKRVIEDFRSIGDAKKYLKERGFDDDEIKLSPKMKKSEAERLSWMTSDKKEYFEEEGVKYGGLKLERSHMSEYPYFITGTDEDGNRKTKMFATKKEAVDYLKGQGIEKCEIDGEATNPSDYEVPETVAVLGGREFQKLYFTSPGEGLLHLYGKDIDGEDVFISSMTRTSTISSFKDRLSKYYDVPLDKVTVEDENTKKEIERLQKQEEEIKKRREEFEAKAVWFEGSKYADIHIIKDDYDSYFLEGYNSNGERKRLTTRYSDFDNLIETCRKNGLDIDSLAKDDSIREEIAKMKKREEEFEAKAVDIAGTKYVDPEIAQDSLGDFFLYGYDKRGKIETITDSNSIGAIVKIVEDLGIDVDSLIKQPEVKEEYEKYKKFKAEFDKKAVTLFGDKFADLEMECKSDPDGFTSLFKLTGKDIQGRKREITTSYDLSYIQRQLESSGCDTQKIAMSEESRKVYDKKMREFQAIESGEYHSVRGRAFKDIRIDYDKRGRVNITGIDVDGERSDINFSAHSIDEAMDEMEMIDITDYKLYNRSTNKETDRPTDGMRRIRMMRTPAGHFVIMATVGKDEIKEIHRSASENNARKWLKDQGIDESRIKTKGMNPNDDVPRVHSSKSLENFDTHRADSEDRYDILRDMSDDEKKEVVEMMTEVFEKGAYRMHRSSEHFDEIVLSHFKNTLETGTSGGAKGEHLRRETEEGMLGVKGHKAIEGEKYGYLGFEDDDEDDALGIGYGKISFKFKRSAVEDRVTYTCGDSLDSRYCVDGDTDIPLAGYGGKNPTYEGISALSRYHYDNVLDAYRRYKEGDITYHEFFEEFSNECRDEYIECHYHDMLTIADVESVSMSYSKAVEIFKYTSRERAEAIIKRLKENNVIFKIKGGSKPIDGYEMVREEFGIE